MKIQVNTGHHIVLDTATEQLLTSGITSRLEHFSDRITRVERHLRDDDGVNRSGARQMHCTLEVRLAGRRPDAVSASAATVEFAVREASGKMSHVLDGIAARERQH